MEKKRKFKTIALLMDDEILKSCLDVAKKEDIPKAVAYRKLLKMGLESYWKKQNLLEKLENGAETISLKESNEKLEAIIKQNLKKITRINNKFENNKTNNIYQNVKNDESV